MTDFPKIIWMYWNKGFVNLPKECLPSYNSYKKFNPEWEIKFLDDNILHKYIDDIDINTINKMKSNNVRVSHISDLLRLCLLKKNGGIWADITTLCTKKLDDWISKYDSELLFFSYKTIEIISSWWFCAKKDSKIIAIIPINIKNP